MSLVSMKTDDYFDRPMTENPYGYGLTLNINGEQCEALGITQPLRAGSIVSIKAIAVVNHVSESVEIGDDDGATDVSLCLQITDMELTTGGKQVDSSAMYPDVTDD